MISQLEDHKILDFIPDYCIEQHELNIKFYRKSHPPQAVRTWGLGRIYDSMSLFFWPAGKVLRSPGRNVETDPKTGAFTTKRLHQTNEYIHPSVRIRLALHGDGPDGKGIWHPEALSGFRLQPPKNGVGEKSQSNTSSSEQDDHYKWVSEINDDVVHLPEERLGRIELELLKCSPQVYERFKHTV
jgi:hypothetical protein